MKSNPYNLKTLDEKPSGYLDADEFFNLLKRKKVPLADKDNLPRFCSGNGIKMFKVKRIGSGGATPTVYKNPTESIIAEILVSGTKHKLIKKKQNLENLIRN